MSPKTNEEILNDIDDLTHAIQMKQMGNMSYKSARDAAWLRLLTEKDKQQEEAVAEERKKLINLKKQFNFFGNKDEVIALPMLVEIIDQLHTPPTK